MAFIPLRQFGEYGLVPDSMSQALPFSAFTDGRNIRFTGLQFEKMLEPSVHASLEGIVGDPRWMQGWSDGLSSYVVVATDTKLWFWRASSATEGEWVDATREDSLSAKVDYPTGKWQSFSWGDTAIFNNGQTAPQIFNQNTLLFEDLPGWGLISTATDLTDSLDPSKDTAARCDYLVPYRGFLVALGCTESGLFQPNTVWWSDATSLAGLNTSTGGGPPSWDYESPATLSAKSEIGVGDGRLITGVQLNENLILYTEGSATAMRLVGGNAVMSFRRLFKKGCAARHTVAEFNNRHFVVSSDEIYIHDGSTVQNVAKERIEEEFFTRAGKGGRFGGGDIDYDRMQVIKNPDRHEIHVVFDEATE